MPGQAGGPDETPPLGASTTIRYTRRAYSFLDRLGRSDLPAYHKLRGTIMLLATSPGIDGASNVLMDFGGDSPTPVHVSSDWWIVYRVDYESTGEQTLSVLSIWDAGSPPQRRL